MKRLSLDYAWDQTTAGVPYKNCVETALDPGTSDEARRKMEFVRDLFGNVTEQRQYEYNEANTPYKTTRNTYLTEPAYVSRHIFNRLVSRSVSDASGTVELASYRYDTTSLAERAGTLEHDGENCGTSNAIRGNVTEAVKGGVVVNRSYFDATGLRIATEDRSGKRTEHKPPSSWGLSNQIDPNANAEEIVAQIQSKSWGRQWTRLSQGEGPALYTHDAENKTVTIANEKGWKKMTIDGFGRVVSMHKGKGDEIESTSEFEYDSQSGAGKSRRGGKRRAMFYRPRRATLPHAPNGKAEWVEYSYDSLGRVKNAGTNRFVYKGNSALIMDAGGGWKKLVRNAEGKIQKVVTPNPQSGPDLETAYRYNRQGKLIGITMPRLDGTQKREFLSNPDTNPEPKETVDSQPESGKERRTFNATGKLESRTDAKGQRVVYSYDDKERLVSVQRYDAMGQIQADQCVTYYYDVNPFDETFSQNTKDQLAAVQWGSVDTEPGLMTEMYSYVFKDKKSAKRLRINRGGKDIDLDLRYSYDGHGRISTIDYPHGPSLRYTYDSNGRPIQLMRGEKALVKDVVYDTVTGRLVSYKQLVLETGEYLEQNQELDSKHQLSRVAAEFEQDKEPVADIEYEYDGISRVSKETDRLSNEVTQYEYDASGRLKRASNAGAGDGTWEAKYSYDGFGNREKQEKTIGFVPESNVRHDPATNRIDAASVGYDDNGNIVKLFDMNLTFDIENRLIAIDRMNKGKELYAYNPSNLRIWKRQATGEEEIHIYGNGGRRVATYKLTMDGEGNANVSLLESDIYFAGKLLQSDDKPVVLDRLGNVRAWIDANRDVQRTKYYPFGEERQVTKNDRKKFSAFVRDDFSELDYAEQRYYSSALGRFITPDPFRGVQPGNPDSWNRYAYVENDPINYTDPHGLYRLTSGAGGWIWAKSGGQTIATLMSSGQMYINPQYTQPQELLNYQTISGGIQFGFANAEQANLIGYDALYNPLVVAADGVQEVKVGLGFYAGNPYAYFYLPDLLQLLYWESVPGGYMQAYNQNDYPWERRVSMNNWPSGFRAVYASVSMPSINPDNTTNVGILKYPPGAGLATIQAATFLDYDEDSLYFMVNVEQDASPYINIQLSSNFPVLQNSISWSPSLQGTPLIKALPKSSIPDYGSGFAYVNATFITAAGQSPAAKVKVTKSPYQWVADKLTQLGLQIPQDVLNAMVDAVKTSDQCPNPVTSQGATPDGKYYITVTGGFCETGATWGKDAQNNLKILSVSGNSIDPLTDNSHATINFSSTSELVTIDGRFHVHPSGYIDKRQLGSTGGPALAWGDPSDLQRKFTQGPSSGGGLSDASVVVPGAINLVIGARDKIITHFDVQGGSIHIIKCK